MGQRWLAVLVGWVLAFSAAAQTPTVVKVGVYPFLPFSDGSAGLTHELVDALNAFQSEYRFETVSTSANRRYRDMADGAYSHIFFENIKWGWQGTPVEASKVYLKGDGEVFVARAQRGRGQEYFQTLTDKDLMVVLGVMVGKLTKIAQGETITHANGLRDRVTTPSVVVVTRLTDNGETDRKSVV